ncbi:hypothetical protein [Pasteuria penetrans]|uniref:hypothetical protein n=1 Tax=Pasteuria penetrans TaxID=86005 RepID=UPI00165B0E84|nr:hypothetical protein [Pasteuria penetrans]
MDITNRWVQRFGISVSGKLCELMEVCNWPFGAGALVEAGSEPPNAAGVGTTRW